MLQVRVDTFPLVVTTFGEGFEQVDFDAYREGHRAVLARGVPYVSVLDTGALTTIPSLDLREEILAFTRELAVPASEYCLSTEVVVKSVAVRAALSAVQWFSSSQGRVSLHASLRPAVARAMDVLWTHQIQIPAELLAYHDGVIREVSLPPPARTSGAFGKRVFESSIEGLLRRVRKTDGQSDRG